MKKQNFIEKNYLALGLVLLAIISRFLPHWDNFSPLYSVALFSGMILSNRKLSIGIIFLAMFISDIFLGWHESMVSVYLSFGIIVYLGDFFKNKKSIANIFAGSIVSALIFFVLTNFTVWAFGGFYELSFAGLVECYTMAIPFLRPTFYSSIFYSALLFGIYEAATRYFTKPNEVLAK